ncbi:MAG: pyridoxal phosphate-dependent aminotransferase [Salinirussus sp.]
MSSFSRRVMNVEPSATVRIGDLAAELRSHGQEIVDLSQGDPDFDTPDHVRRAAREAIESGETHYTPSAGIQPLREAIARKLESDNDLDATPDSVTVTPGGKQALFETLSALLGEGDEVVLLDPSWVSYEAIVNLCGGRLNRVPLDPDSGFRLDESVLTEAIGDQTKAILINTPSNPTGAVLPRSDLMAIRDLCVDHDVWAVADEIYESIRYGVDHVSLGSLDGMRDRTVTVNGFSKSHAMTGWRLGYFHGPEPLVEQSRKVQSHTVTCATSFAQHGAVAALEGPQTPVDEMVGTFERRRDAAISTLSDAGLSVPTPDGAFYLFLPVTTDDDVGLCERLLEEDGLAVTPGSAFGMDGFVRVSYAAAVGDVERGIETLAPHLAD